MNRKRALILILILFTSLFPLIPIPIAKASELVVVVPLIYDDVWMTESGNIFYQTFMVVMLDEEIGIHSFIRFNDLEISKSAKINYATLTIYGAESYETPDPGSSVTIYGIDEPDCAPFTSDGSLWSLSRPYTSASVNWDTSEWGGYRSVNVTDIVKEIINQYAWEFGNSLGLQILGASDSGYKSRSFEDTYHPYHDQPAKLTIVYDVAPGTPGGLPDDAVFEETYGEWDIWSSPGKALGYSLEPIEYVFTEGTGTPYDVMYDNLSGLGPIAIAQSESSSVTTSGMRKLIRTSDGTLYTTYHKQVTGKYQIHIKKSLDNGTTWIDETLISTYAGMDINDQWSSSVAVDSSDNIHVLWYGKATGHALDQTWYNKYNSTHWSGPVRLSTGILTGQTQGPPGITVDSNDYVHAIWGGKADGYAKYQIWYSSYTTSWSDPLRISTYEGMQTYDQYQSSIAMDSNDKLHTLWYGKATGFIAGHQIWYSSYTTSWSDPLRISTYEGMENRDQWVQSVALDSSEAVYAVWTGEATGFATNQIWIVNYTGSWGTPIRISNYTGMATYIQGSATIALDDNEDIHVLWHGKATGFLDEDKVWYTNYTTDWLEPVCVQPIGKNKHPMLRWSRWPEFELLADTFYLVDENNKVITTWNGDNFTDIDDLMDWVDDYVDPGGGDPLDPDPGTQGWDTEGPWTRFRMRLYILFMGLGCFFTPLWAMAYKKFDAVGYAGCFIIMVMGVGLLWSITGI